MSTPYVGEIILVGFNFEPVGWKFCNGQILSIADNDTLFNLIGTTYGGDGQTTFALPDLRGRIPIGVGQGTGLTNYPIGESGGTEAVFLTVAQTPTHTHAVSPGSVTAAAKCKNGAANARTPVTNVPAAEAAGVTMTYSNATPDANMSGGAIALSGGATLPAGGTQPHSNLQPSLAMNYIISLFGLFPSQV